MSTPEQALAAAHDAQDAWAHSRQAPPAAPPDVPPGNVPAGLAGFHVTDRTDPHAAGPVAVSLPPVPDAGSKHTGPVWATRAAPGRSRGHRMRSRRCSRR